MVEKSLGSRYLIKEFRTRLAEIDDPNINTDAIVILSAPPGKDEWGETVEDTPENIARIKHGVEVVKTITSAKVDKALDTLTPDDIQKYAPPLVLDGETPQLPMMLEETKKLDWPENKIILVNSGERGESNTKTQFEALRQDERFKDKFLTIVTTGYHLPRVDRTAAQQLPNQEFEVIAMPYEKHPFSIFIIRGEIGRVQRYVAKGDIAASPKPKSKV